MSYSFVVVEYLLGSPYKCVCTVGIFGIIILGWFFVLSPVEVCDFFIYGIEYSKGTDYFKGFSLSMLC